MKKGNKKFNWGVLFCIGMFIILGLLLILIFGKPYPFQPSFTITTEECRNETVYSPDCSYIKMGHVINNCNFSQEKDEDGCYIMKEKEIIGYNKVCEQKEVEEIFISQGTKIIVNNRTRKYFQDFNISSKDLTTSWLDENCECVQVKTKKGHESHDEELIKGQYYGVKEKYGYSDWFCSKYSCFEGKYLVEVQI